MHMVLREKGLSEAAALTAIRLALVIHGLAIVLDAERVNAPQLVRA
jgi:hypothetical protein